MKRETVEELIDYRDSECCQTCNHAKVNWSTRLCAVAHHYESVECTKFDMPVSSICICDHYEGETDNGQDL